MSQYENRAAVIKAAAAALGWSVRWTRQRSKVYFHVSVGASEAKHITVGNWVTEWYPNSYMTSWTGKGGTFFICDIWEVLKT